VLLSAARAARRFVETAQDAHGAYRIGTWPSVRRRRAVRIGPMVARLRIAQRSTMGFLDPVADALFVLAGLRWTGVPATFHLGRELVPAAGVAGFFAWVEVQGRVVSTSLPVQQTYVEVFREEQG
jgi:hypothetical protein